MITIDSLALELRFRPVADARVWNEVLAAIIAWSPSLQPATVLRLADPEQREEPWSPSIRSAICQACAAGVKDGWLLSASSAPCGAITLDVRQAELRCSLALQRPDQNAADALLGLLEALRSINPPAAAMAFNLADPVDRELVLQGLTGLFQVPPLLYLDEKAAIAAGGIDHVRTAPCTVSTAPAGWLMELRTDPWRPQNESDQIRRAAVEHHLGISQRTPLVLLAHEITP